MKILRDSWVQSEVGSVADEINEKVLDPDKSGYDRFIRPEDLEVGEFNVRSYRTPEDVGSGKRCYDGDILFARRSVSVSQFKRRSCIIKFNAICSDEITVIRQDNSKLHPGFLNLVLNTTPLWDFAIAHSVGSVSKRIKWDDLSKYKFFHPKEVKDQEQITSLFQSIGSAIEEVEGQEKNLTTLKKQLLRDLFSRTPKFGNYLTNQDFEPVIFDKLANNISERVEPKETDLEFYVGLEHLDKDSLSIERTGKPEDVIGTKLKIYKGDIIFGKRRAYLRKVAVSHFDGIASAHSMILRANENIIEKDLLPYFMQSDTFMERAVQISEGSLSPTIKWKTLAAQEFMLPKKDKQSRLIEIFKQFDTTINLLKQQASALRTLKQNLLNEILG
jgi:hypothetical protein